MKILLNGTAHTTTDGTTLADFLKQLGMPCKGVAIAIDGNLIPRTEWAATVLTEGVDLLAIYAVSGG